MANEVRIQLKEILEEAALNAVGTMIEFNTPFQILMWNYDNWDKALPDSIKTEVPQPFLIGLDGWSLENSFITDEGEIALTVAFGDDEYSKYLEYEDLVAVYYNGQPIIINPIVEVEEVSNKKEEINSFEQNNQQGLERSMNAFRKNNPHMNI